MEPRTDEEASSRAEAQLPSGALVFPGLADIGCQGCCGRGVLPASTSWDSLRSSSVSSMGIFGSSLPSRSSMARYRGWRPSAEAWLLGFRGMVEIHSTLFSRHSLHSSADESRTHLRRRTLQKSQLRAARFRSWSGTRRRRPLLGGKGATETRSSSMAVCR
jgi:hypothetical protein